MALPRFLFRAKDREIEEEAKTLLDSLGIDDVEVRRDETVAEAWLEDNEVMRTIYGFEEIKEYLQELTASK